MKKAPVQLVLHNPEIPPNTGNIARLCAGTATPLHLIEPLGFSLDDKHLKRAGLDYWPSVELTVWPDLQAFLEAMAPGRVVPASAKRGIPCHRFGFRKGDALLLGPETRGLPQDLLERFGPGVRIPITDKVRSLNLSTSAGILLHQALADTGHMDGLAGGEE